MKILFLASRNPYPTTKGDQLRVANFLQQLVDLGHQVDFVCSTEDLVSPDSHWASFPPQLNKVIICGYGRFERYTNLIKPLFTLQPFQVAYFYNKQMQAQINRLTAQTRYDTVICQMVRTAPYVSGLKTAKILDFQDAYSLNMYKRYSSETGLVKWVAWLEWHLLAKYEKRLLRKFDKTMIISQRDKRVIGNQAIAVINNGVEVSSQNVTKVPHQIVFSGNLQYFPNREAIVWFAINVFPLIKQAIPQASLKITGATPPHDVTELASWEGINIVANPPDMSAEISSAQVSIAPMLSGSGMQNKVIEAMAVGVPVVLTKHALEGLGPNAEQASVLCDAIPENMAQAVIDLLHDAKRCQAIGELGVEYVKQNHSWKKVGRQLSDLL